MSTSSQNIPKGTFPVIYNDINAILRLVQTKESVSRFVELMKEFADLWRGYNTKREMNRKDMKFFFQSIISVMDALNSRIRITQLRLINNEQERVTYMIKFLRGVHESITNYEFPVYNLYQHVLGLLNSYNPPVLRLLHVVDESAMPRVHEDAEEVEDRDDGDGKVVVKQGGRGKMMNENGGISSLLCRMKELSV